MESPNRPEGQAGTELDTCDLSALEPEDFRHWLSTAVVQSMLATDAGPRIDRMKLGDLVERHVDRLLDGNQLDFAPIYAALCRIRGVSEASLYIGVVNLQQRLAALNVEMTMPDMRLDQWTRAQLLREAHEATEKSRQEHEQVRLRSAVKDLNRAKLGALLVQQGLISERELEEALEQQRQVGGRLGSNLVQLGFVREADLARFLGQQLGLPCVTEIKNIAPEVRRAVPQELLLKHRLVPLTIDGHEIQVAMVDPTDLVAIDEVGFVTDRQLRPVVAPELVVDFARARFFGIRQPPRLLGNERQAVDGPPAWPRAMAERLPVVLPAPDEEPYDLFELAHDLLTAEVEADLYAPLWRLWVDRFHVAAELAIDGAMIRGRRLAGAPTAARRFGTTEVPASSDPIIARVVDRKAPYQGPGGSPTGRPWLIEQLDLTPTSIVWVVPVLDANDGVTGLLVGHLPKGDPPEPQWTDTVCTGVGAAMRMVQARKAIRRIQATGRPTVHRVEATV